MAYAVGFHPTASAELRQIYQYIADKSGSRIALNHVHGIWEYCISLASFPQRGLEYPEIMPGLRILGYRRSASIAFVIRCEQITILGVFSAGREISPDMLTGRL